MSFGLTNPRQSLAARLQPAKRAHRDLESPIQRSLLELIWAAYPDVLVYSIPNGGFILDRRIVAKLKWLGLLPGMPDLGLLLWTNGHGFIETKSEGGVLTPDQKAVHAILREKNHRVEVCRSPEDLRAVLFKWGVPSRESRG